MSTKIISAKNLCFAYESSVDNNLKDISFDIYQGEVILVSGNSGSGKSTLLKCINGLIPHMIDGEYKGSVEVDGKIVENTSIHALSESIGTVFQNPRSQFFTTNSTAELVFAMENFGKSKSFMENEIEALTKEFGLDELLNRDIYQLSSGERQLLAIACSKTMNQKIMLFDEPSANLDYGNAMKLSRIITKLKASGVTVIVSDHRFYYLSGIIDRVLLMNDGALTIYDSEQSFIDSSYNTRSFNLFDMDIADRIVEPYDNEVASIENLSFKNVLDNVNLKLYKNEVVALVGVNGVGKTTLSRLLTKALKPSKGVVNMDSFPYYIMQDSDYQLFGSSVLGEFKLMPEAIDNEDIMLVLKSLGLDKLIDVHPFELSGGQKQRLQIAISCLMNRDLIIFDEPTSGLDVSSMKSVTDEVLNLSNNSSILVISHDYEFIRNVASRVVYLDEKTVKEDFLLAGNVCRLNSIFKDMEAKYED